MRGCKGRRETTGSPIIDLLSYALSAAALHAAIIILQSVSVGRDRKTSALNLSDHICTGSPRRPFALCPRFRSQRSGNPAFDRQEHWPDMTGTARGGIQCPQSDGAPPASKTGRPPTNELVRPPTLSVRKACQGQHGRRDSPVRSRSRPRHLENRKTFDTPES